MLESLIQIFLIVNDTYSTCSNKNKDINLIWTVGYRNTMINPAKSTRPIFPRFYTAVGTAGQSIITNTTWGITRYSSSFTATHTTTLYVLGRKRSASLKKHTIEEKEHYRGKSTLSRKKNTIEEKEHYLGKKNPLIFFLVI